MMQESSMNTSMHTRLGLNLQRAAGTEIRVVSFSERHGDAFPFRVPSQNPRSLLSLLPLVSGKGVSHPFVAQIAVRGFAVPTATGCSSTLL